MDSCNYKINVRKITSIMFMLFVFVLVIDPANTLFHAKELIFAAIFVILFLSYHEIDRRVLVIFLALYTLITFSLLRGRLTGYTFDWEFTGYVYRTFLPLLLLLWMRKRTFFTWKSIFYPSFIVSFFTIFVTVVMLYYPPIEEIVYDFVMEKGIMLMSRRNYLGVEVTGAYYRSMPVVILPATVLFYKAAFENKHRWRNICFSMIIAIALIIAGTRALMLGTIIVIGVVIMTRLSISHSGRFLLSLMAVIFIPVLLYFIYKFMADVGETSNAIKYGHIESYLDLLKDDPMILFFGSGPGSRFFSKGFGLYTEQTEWSYLEFIRMFGIVTTFFLLLVYTFPLYKVYKRRKQLEYSLAFLTSYLMYLIIAGTNPLLIGSNGTLALLYAYSYSFSKRQKQLNNDFI